MMIRVANVFMLIHVDWITSAHILFFICLIPPFLTLSYSLSSHLHVQQRRCCFQESNGDEDPTIDANDILEGDYINETNSVEMPQCNC